MSTPNINDDTTQRYVKGESPMHGTEYKRTGAKTQYTRDINPDCPRYICPFHHDDLTDPKLCDKCWYAKH